MFTVPIQFNLFLYLLLCLMIFFFLVSRCFCFGNAYNFVYVFVAVCFFLLYALVCLLPCHTRCSFIDVLSCTPTGVSEINYVT